MCSVDTNKGDPHWSVWRQLQEWDEQGSADRAGGKPKYVCPCVCPSVRARVSVSVYVCVCVCESMRCVCKSRRYAFVCVRMRCVCKSMRYVRICVRVWSACVRVWGIFACAYARVCINISTRICTSIRAYTFVTTYAFQPPCPEVWRTEIRVIGHMYIPDGHTRLDVWFVRMFTCYSTNVDSYDL